jgi:hypothetical protein
MLVVVFLLENIDIFHKISMINRLIFYQISTVRRNADAEADGYCSGTAFIPRRICGIVDKGYK